MCVYLYMVVFYVKSDSAQVCVWVSGLWCVSAYAQCACTCVICTCVCNIYVVFYDVCSCVNIYVLKTDNAVSTNNIRYHYKSFYAQNAQCHIIYKMQLNSSFLSSVVQVVYMF